MSTYSLTIHDDIINIVTNICQTYVDSILHIIVHMSKHDDIIDIITNRCQNHVTYVVFWLFPVRTWRWRWKHAHRCWLAPAGQHLLSAAGVMYLLRQCWSHSPLCQGVKTDPSDHLSADGCDVLVVETKRRAVGPTREHLRANQIFPSNWQDFSFVNFKGIFEGLRLRV